MSTPLPPPTMVKTNGIELALYEMGSKTGIPVVLCHGFPELAYSWRKQLPVLAAAGYRAIALDQRGYGKSSSPKDVDAYTITQLTGDLIGVLDALKIDKAVFCGHDWGALVTWMLPLLYPQRVLGMIGLNVPFMARTPIDPIELFRKVYGDDMYIVQFQQPQLAESILEKDVAKTFRLFMRRPTRPIAHAPKTSSLNLLAALQSDKETERGELFLTPDEMKVFVDTFTKTGFRGPVNWYRNFTRNWEIMEPYEHKVHVPSLMILAEDDTVLPPRLADGMEELVPDLEKVLIHNCGHWTQQERPEETNAAILGWLKRRMAPSKD